MPKTCKECIESKLQRFHGCGLPGVDFTGDNGDAFFRSGWDKTKKRWRHHMSECPRSTMQRNPDALLIANIWGASDRCPLDPFKCGVSIWKRTAAVKAEATWAEFNKGDD